MGMVVSWSDRWVERVRDANAMPRWVKKKSKSHSKPHVRGLVLCVSRPKLHCCPSVRRESSHAKLNLHQASTIAFLTMSIPTGFGGMNPELVIAAEVLKRLKIA